jgi:hypothetical protein
MRLLVEGYSSTNTLSKQFVHGWITVPRDDRWYVFVPSMKRDAFPSGTRIGLWAGAGLAVAGALVMGLYLVRGMHVASRQSLEPLSAAEERCESVAPPPHLASSPQWHECVEREMQEGPLVAAIPELAKAAGAAVVVLVGALFLVSGGRRSRRSGRTDSGLPQSRDCIQGVEGRAEEGQDGP